MPFERRLTRPFRDCKGVSWSPVTGHEFIQRVADSGQGISLIDPHGRGDRSIQRKPRE
jgi:hypothetical protein